MITEDHNFELLPSEDAVDGMVFGIGQHMSMDSTGFVPGSTDWMTQDSEDQTTGVTHFGRERLMGPTWAWALHVNREDVAGALETLGAFSTAWRALHIRDTPGAVIPLRYQLEGRTRRIYGRPRRYEAPPDNLILGGYVPVAVDFKCVDAFTYSDEQTFVSLALGSELADPDAVDSGGGFIFPVTFPNDTLPPTTQQAQILVGGDADAHPVIRFNGPVVNPSLATSDWTLSLNYTIPDGQYVEVDTRPWRNTVLLNGTTGLGGVLGRRTRLSKVVFKQGRFQARYNGYSSGSSTCEVRWADTWNSL